MTHLDIIRSRCLRPTLLAAALALLASGCAGPATEPVALRAEGAPPSALAIPASVTADRPAPETPPQKSKSATRTSTAADKQPRQTAAATSASKPSYKIGAPYTVGDRTYVPAEDHAYDAVGQASFYGEKFHGQRTANGEIFDMNALTAAHPTLPMPSYVLVTNQRNGRTVLLRVNNRGPYVPGRIIDVSRAAAKMLDFTQYGVTDVRVRYAGRAPLDGDTSRERQHLAAQSWYRDDPVQRTAEAKR